MKKIFVILIVLVLTSMSAWANGSLEISTGQHNFGLIPQNSILVHTFWIKAVGTDTVRIDAIKTGCSCAISKMERDWLAPGDSLAIEIEWDVSKYRNSIYRSIRIFYNNIKKPLRKGLKGTVIQTLDSARPVSISPYRFELASSALKEIDSIQFTLTNHSSGDQKIQNISKEPVQCKLVLPSIIPAGSSATGYVRIYPEYKDKEFHTSVTLAIGDQQQTNLTIPIRRKIYR
ncbi:MAG: hypothetical protein DRP47_00235 [Candidatus Zixiibacteriota bacterium]|nr:MAG: hypothetical protein DRP47_00235 [candidate division Zixibacteria bacterium]